ncbi:MAG: LysE family translocator, partial [Pseudomonadota bacterium]
MMLTTETWLAFASATLLFAYMPGPALLYTAAQTLAGGRAHGLRAVAGIHPGCYVHVFAATLGLTALLAAVPLAFMVLKIAGALYLMWLGLTLVWQAWREGNCVARPSSSAMRGRAKQTSGGPGDNGDLETAQSSANGPRRPLLQSAIVEIANPKAALFFYAFLPQFVDPAAGAAVWLQFLVLGTLVNIAFSSA